MISTKTKIGLLVGAHFVAAPATAWLAWGQSWPHPSVVAFQSVREGQVILLAVWLGLGTTKLRWRFPFVLLGLVAESAIRFVRSGAFHIDDLDYRRNWTLEQLVLHSFVVIVASVVLAVARSRRHLVRAKYSNEPAFQFSLRHLMLMVLFVSLFLGTTRIVRPLSGFYLPLTHESWLPLSVEGLVASIIALSAVWAAMTPSRPHWGAVTAVLLAGCLGFWKAYCLAWDGWANHAATIATHTFRATVAIASLLVIRSAGWRLVPRRSASTANSDR